MPRASKPPARPGRRSATVASFSPRSTPGPSQRQLRAGELVRHALVEILREQTLADPVLAGVSVTLAEVRMSPDLRHALCFVMPLGGEAAPDVVAGLNRATRFLRGELGRAVELKFTPDLKFISDNSFDEAERIGRLFDNPKVRQDLEAARGDNEGGEDNAPETGDGA